MTCNYCEEAPNGGGCDEIRAEYEENAYTMQAITKHGAQMQYECSLGKEFLVNNVTWETVAKDNLTCHWDTEWKPRNYLHECVCKCGGSRWGSTVLYYGHHFFLLLPPHPRGFLHQPSRAPRRPPPGGPLRGRHHGRLLPQRHLRVRGGLLLRRGLLQGELRGHVHEEPGRELDGPAAGAALCRPSQ